MCGCRGRITLKAEAGFQPVVGFLTRLAKNNNREWFEAHRGEYESAMDFFSSFVGRLIAEIGKVEELGGITPKDCIMRIIASPSFKKHFGSLWGEILKTARRATSETIRR